MFDGRVAGVADRGRGGAAGGQEVAQWVRPVSAELWARD